MLIEVPLRLGRGGNDRMHWRTKNRQKKAEQEAVGWALAARKDRTKPKPPLIVTLTRVAPSEGLDRDNLVSCFKAIQDSIAAWLGVDDRDASVRYQCDQKRGDWCVLIEIAAL